MNSITFKRFTEELMKRCDDTLLDRAEAYAGADRLENFKQIAHLTGLSPAMIAYVLHAKHIVALGKAVANHNFSRTTEYIVDIINYQRLLYAIIFEECQKDEVRPQPAPIMPEEGGYIQTHRRPLDPAEKEHK